MCLRAYLEWSTGVLMLMGKTSFASGRTGVLDGETRTGRDPVVEGYSMRQL